MSKLLSLQLLICQYDSELDEINVLRFFHESQNYLEMM